MHFVVDMNFILMCVYLKIIFLIFRKIGDFVIPTFNTNAKRMFQNLLNEATKYGLFDS